METEFQDDQGSDMEQETVLSSDDDDDDDDDNGDDDMVATDDNQSELNEDPDWATLEECTETDDEESYQESQRKGSHNKVRYIILYRMCVCIPIYLPAWLSTYLPTHTDHYFKLKAEYIYFNIGLKQDNQSMRNLNLLFS